MSCLLASARGESDPTDWPLLPALPASACATEAMRDCAPQSSQRAPATPAAVQSPTDTRHAVIAALLQYAHQWLEAPPFRDPAVESDECDDSGRRKGEGDSTSAVHCGAAGGGSRVAAGPSLSAEATPSTPATSRVAMLNAVLISVPAASASPAVSAPSAEARAGGLDSDSCVSTLRCVLSPAELRSGTAESLAQHLLRHSRWIAAGASHAAGPSPRLLSAALLTQVYQHALLPTCSAASWAAVPAATGVCAGDSAGVARAATAAAASPGTIATADGELFLPSRAVGQCSTDCPAPPTTYRGALVLLLFHRLHCIRVWARDTLLQAMVPQPAPPGAQAGGGGGGDSAARAADAATGSADDGRVSALLAFAVQFLCTLKHCMALASAVSFLTPAEQREAAPAPAHGQPCPPQPRSPPPKGGVLMAVHEERVRVVVEGVHHLLTLLVAWDAQFGEAVERLQLAQDSVHGPAASATASSRRGSSATLAGLLARCKTTVVLLGGSLLLHALQDLHQALCTSVLQAWESQQRHRPLASGWGAAGGQQRDPTRAARAAMAHLAESLNGLLACPPRLPKAAAVSAPAVKKTLMKVLVHCLLDSASGLPTRREEEAWRRARLRWLWSLAAALEPPTLRVAPPLAAEAAAPPDASTAVWVPGRSAGWLLKPLLKNAEQQFQWAAAMVVAKARPTAGAQDRDAVAVLERAVYGAYLLLDSLADAVPLLLPTRYFHDTVACYELQLLTLAIGGMVHAHSWHALQLHRLLVRTDVRAFAAGAAAHDATHTPPSSVGSLGDERHSSSSGGGASLASTPPSMAGRPPGMLEVPTVCLQRVWLTLPTLLTQLCKTRGPLPPASLDGSAAAAAAAGAAGTSPRLPLPHMLAALCTTLGELSCEEASPCPRWLLLTPTEAMAGAAPQPFQWAVQRCLRTLSDTLRDQHDAVARAWLDVPSNPAALSPAAAKAAAAAAATRILTEEKALLRFIYVLRCAAAGDGGLRRLGDHLAGVFCRGIAPAVAESVATEAAEWVWRRVVLTQPSLCGVLDGAPVPRWDVTSAAVANTARLQGQHWLSLLSQLHWAGQEAYAVRCAWWACALLADVVVLEAEQRRVLAEEVLLSLPTAPMTLAAAPPPARGGGGGAALVRAEQMGSSGGLYGLDSSGEGRSADAARQEAQDREELGRLSAVVQHLLLSVLHKAETFPRATLARVLLHLSAALHPARVQRDTAFLAAVTRLLVRLCARRPETHAAVLQPDGPVWLREAAAAAQRSVAADLADQEQRFRQFELEESAMMSEAADAGRLAAAEALVRQRNETKRGRELNHERLSSRAGASAAAAPLLSTRTEKEEDREEVASSGGMKPAATASARVLRQQQLFPDRPLPPLPGPDAEPDRPANHLQLTSGVAGVKRERVDAVVVVDSDGEMAEDDASMIELEVSSDDDEEEGRERRAREHAGLLDRLTFSASADAAAASKRPRTEWSSDGGGGSAAALRGSSSPTGTDATRTESRTAKGGQPPPPPPTRLQQKLQAINARNTHRVHHADQLRQLQERLCRVAASTSLLHLQPPLQHDIIGQSAQCMAPRVPVLPDVFVAAEEALAEPSAASTTATMPFGDAASTYAARFAPHIALELRCDIVRNYEDMIESLTRSAPQVQQARVPAPAPPPPPAMAWSEMLPLHPAIPSTCFAVQSVGATQAGGGASEGNAVDPLNFRFHIRAGGLPPAGRTAAAATAPRLADPAVRAVAEQGLSAGLSEGDVVVVLLPLLPLAEAWVERQAGGVRLTSLPAEERAARVQAALAQLPKSWRVLGCLTQVCYVQSLLFGERTARLCAYPPVEPRPHHGSGGSGAHLSSSDASAVVQPLRFVHAMRSAYLSTHSIFFVKKLTSLSSFQMELAALHAVDHTRFAGTLYDPRYAAPINGAYYNWITSLLAAPGPGHLPVLALLRRRLLLQRQLNDWQLRAILAVLFAACPDWEGGEAQRSVGAAPPRAPEVLLIEGPPGTGKTQTIGSLTLNVLHHLSHTRGATARVLVCAPSNCAVDEALLRVVHLRQQLLHHRSGGSGGDGGSRDGDPQPAHSVLSGRILRVGVKERVDAEVLKLPEPVFFDDVVEQEVTTMTSGRATSTAAAKNGLRNTARANTIDSASVIFSTLGSLHRITRQVHGLSFDVVIVDEASQGTEPAVLQAVVLARGKCVLVGDSKQLQPTILSQEASRCGLRRSLLVRMLACGHKSFLLRTQYRMHPDICAFPNTYFYAGQLATDRSVRQRSRTNARSSGLLSDVAAHDPAGMTVAQRLGRCPRFVFVDVPDAAMERRRGRSLMNRSEAAAVVQYVRQLRAFLGLSVRDMAPQLGIITFYAAQKDIIVSMLTREERLSGLQVATVDSFQGKEKRIILLSCVRTVKPGQLLERHTRAEEDDGDARAAAAGVPEAATFEERLESRRVGRFGLGFLADGHRLNVALTRAQDLCVCFSSGDSLRAVEAAVEASSSSSARRTRMSGDAGHLSQSLSQHHLTTADSAVDDVVRQLDADDEDPLALVSMLRHAERHDPCVAADTQPNAMTAPSVESWTDSVEIVDAPAAAAAVAACVRFDGQSKLIHELTRRARLVAGDSNSSQRTQD